jgi:hypothetical protein
MRTVGYTRHKLGAILSTKKVNRQMEVALSGVYADMYSIVASLDLRVGNASFSPSSVRVYPRVSFMYAHVGIAGNERSYFEARQASLGNMEYNAQSVTRDLLPIAKQRMLDEWQKSWEIAEIGKFAHSIFPRVSLRPWFEEWRTKSKLITTVSRIISGHCAVRAHLKRFSIFDGSMCVCLEYHETVDHII